MPRSARVATSVAALLVGLTVALAALGHPRVAFTVAILAAAAALTALRELVNREN